MLPDKFYQAYTETADKPPVADPEDDPGEKMYTAAEVDALVNDRVASAVEEIKKSLNEPEDPAGKEPKNVKEGNEPEEA